MSRTRDRRESPAKRFRNVLYHMWQLNDAGFEDFDVFYDDRMEKLIEYYTKKNKKNDKNSVKKQNK